MENKPKFILDDSNLWTDDALTDRQTDRPQTLSEKIEESKRALKLAAEMSREYYHKPLVVTYSGGKDSDVMLHLAETTLEPHEYEVLNSHTTVDAPETVYHIREVFDRLKRHGIKTNIDYHIVDGKPITMWNLIPKKQMPPTRLMRYCCAVLKEASSPNRVTAVGVREDESHNREGRSIFATRGGTYREAKFFSLSHAIEVYRESQEIQDEAWDCTLIKNMKKNNDTIVNPIYHWSEVDIWDYIQSEHICTNPLYKCGYHRVGCIGCPLATYKMRIKEFQDYPKFKNAYILAFDRMIKVREKAGKSNRNTQGYEQSWHDWTDGKAVFDWWLEEYKRNVKGQITIDEWLKEGSE